MNRIKFYDLAKKLALVGLVAAAFAEAPLNAQPDALLTEEIEPSLHLGKDTSPEFSRPDLVYPPKTEKYTSREADSNPAAVDSEVDTSNKNEVMIWGGYSPDSTTALPFAGSRDAKFGLVGLKYARRFNNGSKYNFKYTAEVYPVAGLNFLDNGTRKTEYAFGFSPFGVQMNFRPRKKFQPFIGAAGGALIFSKSIPNPLGTKFNFTADFSLGLEIRARSNQSVSVGYKLFHISNGGRGRINPSWDNNVFFAGYSYLF